ncbi:TPA: hypothetical protein I9Y37_001919 [Citrobacter freundii]|nr:hypothetical protein [Citrobacter freundii]HAT3963894.1 hypothetical protein [Citrobacter freundii]
MSALFDFVINILWGYGSYSILRIGFQKNNMLGRIFLMVGGASMGLSLHHLITGIMG